MAASRIKAADAITASALYAMYGPTIYAKISTSTEPNRR
jgi:hypothetical protein